MIQNSPYLNNAKLTLMVLVVFGHLLEPIMGNSYAVKEVYEMLGVFRLPAFIFLAGMTSRVESKQLVSLLATLVLFQLVYVSLYAEFDLIYLVKPYWLLWFVLSLFFWRLLLPVFYKCRFPLVVSVLIALLVGLVPSIGYALSLSRTFVFLPFFIMGHFYGRGILSWLGSQENGFKISIMLLGALGVAFADCYIDNIFWLYGALSFHAMGVSNIAGLLTRAVHLAAASGGVFMVLALIPTKDYLFSGRGRRTISVYLLHGLFVIPLCPVLFEVSLYNAGIAFVMAISIALLLTWALSAKSVYNAVYLLYKRKIVKPQ